MSCRRLPQVSSLVVELIGETSVASTVSYVDNGFVFVGSVFADSQLVKLLEEPGPSGSFLKVVEPYESLGPIVDFCVMDLDRQGQCQVVTCSGAASNGSLRVVRSGIGIEEQVRASCDCLRC